MATTTRGETYSAADLIDFPHLEDVGVFSSPAARKDALFKAISFLHAEASKQGAGKTSFEAQLHEQSCDEAREALRCLVREVFRPRQREARP